MALGVDAGALEAFRDGERAEWSDCEHLRGSCAIYDGLTVATTSRIDCATMAFRHADEGCHAPKN